MSTFSERFVDHIQEVTPGLRIVKKEDSRLMRFLAIILFFNKGFMTEYTTTIGKTIYMPSQTLSSSGTAIIVTLAHEAQHIWDFYRFRFMPIPWAILYLFPQILAPLALLSFLAVEYSNWWLVSLSFLIFLAPLPAPFRMIIERRGYLVSLACCHWMWNNADSTTIENVVNQFTGWEYYKMWPFYGSLTRWFKDELYFIKEGSFPSPVYRSALKFLRKEKLVQGNKLQ